MRPRRSPQPPHRNKTKRHLDPLTGLSDIEPRWESHGHDLRFVRGGEQLSQLVEIAVALLHCCDDACTTPLSVTVCTHDAVFNKAAAQHT